MKLRSSMFLALLAACSGNGDGPPASMSGALVAGTGSPQAGTGAAGTGAAGTGVSGTGAAGTGTAGAGASGIGASGTGASGTGAAKAGTGGAAGSGNAIAPSFETVKLVLGGGGPIMPCSAAPCHGVGGAAPPAKPLELPPMDDKKLYANLTTYVSAACGNTKLVTPGNPAQSALITILTGPCGMTPRMPYGCSADAGDCIPDEYIAAVKQWIMNGAPP